MDPLVVFARAALVKDDHIVTEGGVVIDLFWAPYAAKKMTEMYSGRQGKIAAVIVFLEEILPLDLIPTFTLMWLYTYVFSGSKNRSESFVEVSAS